MRRFDKINIITEANQRLEREFLKSKGILNEENGVSLNPQEIEIVNNILGSNVLGEGEEVLTESIFKGIRQKFNSALKKASLKKGIMTFGILASILGSPNMTQAQKNVLKQDVKRSTWFRSEVEKVGNKGKDSEYIHRWVNDLGQDSTEYFTHHGGGDHYYDKGASFRQRSRFPQAPNSDSKDAGEVRKTTLNIGDQDLGSATVTMKGGDIDDFLWAKGYSNEWTERITPRQYRQLQKLEELVKDVEYRSTEFWEIIKPIGKEIMKGKDKDKKIALDYFMSDYGTPQSTNKVNNKPFVSPNFVK